MALFVGLTICYIRNILLSTTFRAFTTILLICSVYYYVFLAGR